MNNLYRSGTLVEKLQQRLDILLSSHQFMFCNQYWCDWSWSCVIILRLITLPSGESNYFHVLTKLICLFWLFGLVLQGMIVVVSRFYSHYLFFIITLHPNRSLCLVAVIVIRFTEPIEFRENRLVFWNCWVSVFENQSVLASFHTVFWLKDIGFQWFRSDFSKVKPWSLYMLTPAIRLVIFNLSDETFTLLNDQP